MSIKTAAAVLMTAIYIMSACSSGNNLQTDNMSETLKMIGTQNNGEAAYMKKYSSRITEMQPEKITEKRDGIIYPEFKKYTYYSRTAERETPVNVLLPAGYSEKKNYPVVYILHGYFGNEDWMKMDEVGISAMLTNLSADGKCKEMISVLPYIYCSKDMPECTGMNLQNSLNYDNFINDLTTDLMPFIESSFSVLKGRENTAVTGFSMGGREALFIGFSHPELFGYVGAVCPAPGLVPVENSPDHPGQMSEADMKFDRDAPRFLLISSADNDGVVGSFPDSYRNIMDANGTEYVSHTMSSTGHDQSSVTPHLYNFFRVIFQE